MTGDRDCLDGTDELNCSYRPGCGPDRFKCADGFGCIPKRWVCDGKAECRDGSDEIGCSQKGQRSIYYHSTSQHIQIIFLLFSNLPITSSLFSTFSCPPNPSISWVKSPYISLTSFFFFARHHFSSDHHIIIILIFSSSFSYNQHLPFHIPNIISLNPFDTHTLNIYSKKCFFFSQNLLPLFSLKKLLFQVMKSIFIKFSFSTLLIHLKEEDDDDQNVSLLRQFQTPKGIMIMIIILKSLIACLNLT